MAKFSSKAFVIPSIKNDVKSTGYCQKKGQEPRNPGDKVVLAIS